MVKTIGNPLSWSARMAAEGGHYLTSLKQSISGRDDRMPGIRPIGLTEVRTALRLGFEDFGAFRSDVIFVCLLYPVMGTVLAWLALTGDLVQLIFPVVAGFALIGPFAAVGLYEMSRRRERGQPTNWLAVIDVIRSPSFGAIFALGLSLIGVFLVWILTAGLIHEVTMGTETPRTITGFVRDVFTTQAGITMMLAGIGIGFVFAIVVLAVSVVSFPLLLDREVGLPMAVVTSVRFALMNPVAVGAWGLIVAIGLVAGSLPVLLGLVVVFPVLGHATWHLYRQAIIDPESRAGR